MTALWVDVGEACKTDEDEPDPLARNVAALLDAIAERSPDWMRYAACSGHDVNLWFPRRGESPTPALEVCQRCPTRRACRDWALENGQHVGIYGAMSAKARRQARGMHGAGRGRGAAADLNGHARGRPAPARDPAPANGGGVSGAAPQP